MDAHPLCDFCHVMLLQGAQVVRGGPTPAEVEPLSCEMHGFVLQPSPPLFGARYGFGVALGQKKRQARCHWTGAPLTGVVRVSGFCATGSLSLGWCAIDSKWCVVRGGGLVGVRLGFGALGDNSVQSA